MTVFALILTKSFYIGFIAQRFFFSELWLCAFVAYTFPKPTRSYQLLIPGFIHFSALTIVASQLWVKYDFYWKKFLLACGVLLFICMVLKLFSGFQMAGYDYSRYLDQDAVASFPFLSIFQSAILGLICYCTVPKSKRKILVSLVALALIVRVVFNQIEVVSRVYQIQTDFVIIYTTFYCYRKLWLISGFCIGFLLIQMFGVSTSAEMAMHHMATFSNALGNF